MPEEQTIAISPEVTLPTPHFDSAGLTPPPHVLRHIPDVPVLAHTFSNCGIRLGTGVVFDSLTTPIAETNYMIGETGKPDFEVIPELWDHRIVMCYNAGWRNYYHWLLQAMLTMYVYAPHIRDDDVFVFPSRLKSRIEMMELAGLPRDKIRFFEKDRSFQANKVTVINTCYSRFVMSPSPLAGAMGRSVLEKTNPPPSGVDAIYVSRRDSKNRSMENEDVVEVAMKQRGFTCVVLSQLSFMEQAALFRDARLIVTSHGAGLANVIFCRPGTRVIELAPASYVNPCFIRLGQVLGLRWETHVFPSSTVANQKAITWSVDINRLEKALQEAS